MGQLHKCDDSSSTDAVPHGSSSALQKLAPRIAYQAAEIEEAFIHAAPALHIAVRKIPKSSSYMRGEQGLIS